jgi:hypothetical protein
MVIAAAGVLVALAGVLVPIFVDRGSSNAEPRLQAVRSAIRHEGGRKFAFYLDVQNVGEKPLRGCGVMEQEVDGSGAPSRYLPAQLEYNPVSILPGQTERGEADSGSALRPQGSGSMSNSGLSVSPMT